MPPRLGLKVWCRAAWFRGGVDFSVLLDFYKRLLIVFSLDIELDFIFLLFQLANLGPSDLVLKEEVNHEGAVSGPGQQVRSW